jgi:transcriptional regulator with XRE-family HTH domain
MRGRLAGTEADLRLRGETVSELRRAAGLTQEDVSDTASVSLRFYRMIETGRGNPSYVTMLRVADAIGTPLSEIVRRAERR